ncbi:MAG: class II glutamine amidotransferase [Pseudolabrys sp.]
MRTAMRACTRSPSRPSTANGCASSRNRRLPRRLVVPHIRRATHGGINLANTQPFARELGGAVHVFAHNGDLGGLLHRSMPGPQRFRAIGGTDSEIAFCLLLERHAPLWRGATPPPIEVRREVVEGFAAEMRKIGPASFLYADGDALFAHVDRRLQSDGNISPPGFGRCIGVVPSITMPCARRASISSRAALNKR